MGSWQFVKKQKSCGGRLGKIDAPLNKKLQQVKWGDFVIEKYFEKVKVQTLTYKATDLPSEPTGKYVLPALTAGIQNQGLNNYVPVENATVLQNVISISANGANTGATFFQSHKFTVLQDAYAIKWRGDDELNNHQYLFIAAAISKTIYGNYEWTNKAGWERIKTESIKLPITTDGEIYFGFIAEFVAELEAQRVAELETYLQTTGLKDYVLSNEEQEVLKKYSKWNWSNFNLEALFGKSTRGKRLKSADRVSGELPFVTAGETNEGISDFIGNNVDIFEANTTTIDMFGSAKYRNYKYGGDDHIAVVHTEDLPKHASIFVTTAIHKSSHNGQFNYSNNFYASDADELNIMLPTKNGLPDYNAMATLISAIHKLVIKDIVLYADEKISATKEVIASNK